MQTRQLTLKPKGRKAPDLGPKVDLPAVHVSPAANEAGLTAIINGSGLKDTDKDGLLEHGTDAATMWLGACPGDFKLEFELAEATPLAALEVWNYNADWQTSNGIKKADIAVSTDGSTWQTVLRDVEFPEADGTADYDEPIVLKLNGVVAKKVRLENIVAWNATGKVGLSEVVFHRTQVQ